MQTRRQFISTLAGGAALASGLPSLLMRAAKAAEDSSARILAVLELNGGNDGLNTVVPYADEIYHRLRPTLRVKEEEVLKLDERVGLHPVMKQFKDLVDRGEVAIVQNVGYPNPVRSHFRSMEIWQSGLLGPASTVGWLGRAAEADPTLRAAFFGEGTIPLAVQRRDAAVLAMAPGTELRLDRGARLPAGPAGADPVLADISRRMEAAETVAREFAKFGGRLPALEELASVDGVKAFFTLVQIEPPLRVLYVSIGGFDTHQSQKYQHEGLWQGISRGMSEFMQLVRLTPLADRLLILMFSEFGRRLEENASGGTDHGAGGPVMLVGKRVRGGLHGSPPNLADLDNVGDPRFGIDFRDVYAAVLRDWFNLDPEAVLPGRTPLPLLA